jgi:hypothetical protein
MLATLHCAGVVKVCINVDLVAATLFGQFPQ